MDACAANSARRSDARADDGHGVPAVRPTLQRNHSHFSHRPVCLSSVCLLADVKAPNKPVTSFSVSVSRDAIMIHVVAENRKGFSWMKRSSKGGIAIRFAFYQQFLHWTWFSYLSVRGQLSWKKDMLMSSTNFTCCELNFVSCQFAMFRF